MTNNSILGETTYDQIVNYLPKRIYKYLDWKDEKRKRILTNNEIYFAHPFCFKEHHEFEFRVNTNAYTIDQLYDYYFKNAPSRGYVSNEERNEIATKFSNNPPFKNPNEIDNILDFARKYLADNISIFCVSEHKNNYTLWKDFACGLTGFCVGINRDKMFHNKEDLGGGGRIDYYNESDVPEILPFYNDEKCRLNDFVNIVMSLPKKDYEKEDEYRLIKTKIQNRQVEISIESIEEVILGHFISLEDEKEITEIYKTRFPLAKICKANYDWELQYFSFTNIVV